MIRTVLVPAETSADCALVMRFVVGLRRLGVVRVIVAHVVDASGLEGPVIAAQVDAERERMAACARPLREAGLDVEVRIPAGDPERELLALATEAHVDAIVVGTSGRSTRDAFFAGGSVAERIAVRSTVPVLVVRHDLLRSVSEPAALATRFASRPLVPTDFSAPAQRAFDTLLGFPTDAVGVIRLLHVLPVGAAGQDETGTEFQLRNMVATAKQRGLSAQAVVGHGAPERAALAEIDESRVTGVVIGTRGRSMLKGALVGSVSMTLARQASCPVLIVP